MARLDMRKTTNTCRFRRRSEHYYIKIHNTAILQSKRHKEANVDSSAMSGSQQLVHHERLEMLQLCCEVVLARLCLEEVPVAEGEASHLQEEEALPC